MNTIRPGHLKDRFEPQPHALDILCEVASESSLAITVFYDTMA